MYVTSVWITASLNTSMDAGVSHILYMVICALFLVIWLRSATWVPYTVIESPTALPTTPTLTRPLVPLHDKTFPITGYFPPLISRYLSGGPKPSTPYWCSGESPESHHRIFPWFVPGTWTEPLLPPVHLFLSHIGWTPSTLIYRQTTRPSIVATSPLLCLIWRSVCASTV